METESNNEEIIESNEEEIDEIDNDIEDEKQPEPQNIVEELQKKKLMDYYSGKLQPSIEEFIKLKGFVDKSLDSLGSNIDIAKINEYCNFDISIKKPKQEEFVDLLSCIAEYTAFYIDKNKAVEAYLKTFDKYIDLLKIYLILLSGKKKSEVEAEIQIKLKDYYLKRQVYESLLSKLSGKKEAFETKYAALSRVLAYWKEEIGTSGNTRYKR